MKILLLFFVLFLPISIFGQWTFIIQTNKWEVKYFVRWDTYRKDELGRTSAWLKVVPIKPLPSSRKSKVKIAYVLQYASANCSDRRLTIENSTPYDFRNNPLPYSGELLNSYSKPVIPGSVHSYILDKLCNFSNKLETQNDDPKYFGILNEKAINLVKPNYPLEAKKAGASGLVTVEVTLDENGKVILAKAIAGNALLRAAAEDAAYKSTFSPDELKVKINGLIFYYFTKQ